MCTFKWKLLSELNSCDANKIQVTRGWIIENAFKWFNQMTNRLSAICFVGGSGDFVLSFLLWILRKDVYF